MDNSREFMSNKKGTRIAMNLSRINMNYMYVNRTGKRI